MSTVDRRPGRHRAAQKPLPLDRAEAPDQIVRHAAPRPDIPPPSETARRSPDRYPQRPAAVCLPRNRPASPDWRDGLAGLSPAAVPTRGSDLPPQPICRPPGEEPDATVRIPRLVLAARLPAGPDPSPPTAATPLPASEPASQPGPMSKRRRPGRPGRPGRLAVTKPVGPPEALRPPSMRRMAIGCAVLVAVVAVVLFLAACAPTLMSSGSVPPPAGLVSTLNAPASPAAGGGHR